MSEYHFDKDDMKKYYCVPFNFIRDTKVQSMQYKLLHNFYPCNLKLYHWKIRDNSYCNYCNSVDNINHHFFECNEMVIFWNSLEMWWRQTCTNCFDNKIRNILLGIIGKQCHKPQLNYIILAAKFYIYRTKYLCKRTFFLDFLVELKNKLEMERFILSKNGKFVNFLMMWSDIFDNI